MGAFLRKHPLSGTGKSEKAWEDFSVRCRDTVAPFANTLFTLVVTVAAAMYIYVQEQVKSEGFWIGFALWFAVCLLTIVGLWLSHRDLVKQIDRYEPEKA